MPVIISSEILLNPDNQDQPVRHPRIGYENIARDGTVSASSTATDFLEAAPANGFTYEFWSPSSLPAWWKVDTGEQTTTDYLGVAAHDLGTQGNKITVQSSDDDSTWSDVEEYVPGNDRPIMLLFEAVTARYFRVYIENGSAPQIGSIYMGEVLQMQRPIYGGHTPITLSRNTTIRPNKSEGGQFLGRSIIRDGVSTSFDFDNLTASWYRTNFDPFVLAARKYPFFIAWRPNKFPEEIGYVWTTEDISPQNAGTRDLMSVSFSVVGIGDYE